MVTLRIEGLFPASLERVWRLLQRHRDDAPSIHPDILSQRILREEGEAAWGKLRVPRAVVFEREWRLGRRRWTSTWRYVQAPPERFRVELLEGDEPFAAGSHWENTYREAPGGTLVATEAELVFQGLRVPWFLQGWAVRRAMARSDREDLAYLRRTGL